MTSVYSAIGGRDVLILAPDLSFPHPEAVARRPSQLTVADKLKLLSQGLPLDYQSELAIIRARREMCERNKIVGVKSGQSLTRDEIIKSIDHLLNTTQNNGGREGTVSTRLLKSVWVALLPLKKTSVCICMYCPVTGSTL